MLCEWSLTCPYFEMTLQKFEDIASPLQMLALCEFVELHTGQNGRHAYAAHVIVDQNAYSPAHFLNGELALIFNFFEERMDYVVGFHRHQVLNVGSVDVFFVFLLNLLHELVINCDFLLIF